MDRRTAGSVGIASAEIQRFSFANRTITASEARMPITTAQNPSAPVSKIGRLKFIPMTPATTAPMPSSTVASVSTRITSFVC